MIATRILVTGGAGFIGSNFVLHWIDSGKGRVVNVDALTYASNLGNLASIQITSSCMETSATPS